MHAKEVHHRSNWFETDSTEELEEVPITTEKMARIAISAYPTEPHDMRVLLEQDKAMNDLGRRLSEQSETDSSTQKTKLEIRAYSEDANNPDIVPTTGNLDVLLGTTTQSIKLPSNATDEAVISRNDRGHQAEDEADGSNDEGGVRQALPVRSLDVVMAEPGKMDAATGVRNDNLLVRAFGGGKKIDDKSLEDQGRVEIGAPLNPTDLPVVDGSFGLSSESLPNRAEVSVPAEIHVAVTDQSNPKESQVEVHQAVDRTLDDELRQVVAPAELTRRQYRDLREWFEQIRDNGGTIDDVIMAFNAKIENEPTVAPQDNEYDSVAVEAAVRKRLMDQGLAISQESSVGDVSQSDELSEEDRELAGAARETLRDRLGIKGWSFAFAAKDAAADGMNAVMKSLRKIVYRSDEAELSDDEIIKMNETRRKVIAVSSVVVLGAITLGKSILVAKGFMDASHSSGAAGLGEHVRHVVDTLGTQGGSAAGSSGNPEEIKVTIQSEIDPSQVQFAHLPIEIHENETMTQVAQSINGNMSESDILNTLDSHKADLLSKFGEEGGWLYENVDDNGRLGLAKAGQLPQDLTDELYKIFEAKG